MESISSREAGVAIHTLSQLTEACDMIQYWNRNVSCVDDYVTSPDGMETMAASCMLIESIGEGVKKIDRLIPGFFQEYAPDTPWKSIMGLRDHIAHGYFNLDAEIIFDVAINEIPSLRGQLVFLREILSGQSIQ